MALIDNFTECRLKDVVRIKPEINSFIRNMLDLSDMPKHKVNYDSVDVIIANSMEEFEIVRASYERDGYKYIAYETDECDEYDTYKVIGQEFDKVLVIIDDNFRYDDDGELISKEHQSNDYRFDKMFYQNISRAREKLCIVVANNPDIFEKLLLIKQHNI